MQIMIRFWLLNVSTSMINTQMKNGYVSFSKEHKDTIRTVLCDTNEREIKNIFIFHD